MTLSQFQDLLARYGPALSRWPASAVEPALDLMLASWQAKDAFIYATDVNMGRALDVGRPPDKAIDASSHKPPP